MLGATHPLSVSSHGGVMKRDMGAIVFLNEVILGPNIG